MPLPFQVDSLDSVPESLRSEYTPRDGKFVLQVEGIDDPAPLKANNAKLVAELREARKRAGVLGDRTPEEVQADLEYAAEQRKLDAEKKGRYDDVIKQVTEKSAQAIAAKDKELAERDAEVHALVGERAVIDEINAVGGKVKKLLKPIMEHVKVIRGDDGRAVAVVVDAKGNPRIADASGASMTIKQLVESFKADPDYGVDFPPSGSSGGGARNTGTAGGSTGNVVISSADAKDTAKYRAAKAEAQKRGFVAPIIAA